MKKHLLFLTFVLLASFIGINAQTSYDFRDGSIITAGGSEDGKLTLTGNYSHHGTQYGLNMKAGGTIKIAVDGNCTVQFLGSKYSSLNLVGKVAGTQTSLGTHYTKVTNDVADTYDFVYTGAATTLEFTAEQKDGAGSDLYLPLITLLPAQLGMDATSAQKNVIYTFNFCDGSIVPTDTDGKSNIAKGLIGINVGAKNAYGYNDAQHGSVFKEGNQITLQVAGNTYIKVGGCQYSNGTITLSSTTGAFAEASLSSKTSTCYHTDGATVDFLYVGTAGTVTLDFAGTNYVPCIELVPHPFEVELSAWVQKSGVVTINGVNVTVAMGATSADVPTVSVSAGMVMSTTSDEASVRINMGGTALADLDVTFSGDIASVQKSGDSELTITFANDQTKPNSYKLKVADDSKQVVVEPGKTYSYNFADGSVLPQTDYNTLRYDTFISADGIVTLKSNNDNNKQKFGYHDSSHGLSMFAGNSMELIVAGDATITFGVCQYGSAKDAVFNITNEAGEALGSVKAHQIGEGACGAQSFSYTGKAGIITATLASAEYATAEVYISSVSIENAAEIIRSDKADAWDFGAAILDEAIYTNHLTESVINAWYPDVEPGTSGLTLPNSFTAGVLSWLGGNNDRLRTSNTNLTRYDAGSSPATLGDETFTGNLYVNSSASSSRYFTLTLSEDDEVLIYAKSQSGGGKLTFQYMGDDTQTDVLDVASSLSLNKFVAKKKGAYHIYDAGDKPFYYRIIRKNATYATLSGALNLDAASGIPAQFNLVLTNEAGKEFAKQLTSTSTSYTISVPAGYNYKLSLGDANGYVIANGTEVAISENTTRDISIAAVTTYTLSGKLAGLTTEEAARMELNFTSSDPSVIFKPTAVVNAEALTYSVGLEPNNKYAISASGINDFEITNNEVTITANTEADITFAPKTKHAVTINANGLTAAQQGELSITFTNLKEEGYTYTFTGLTGIALRDGEYSIACSGLDAYPLELAATSNLKVAGGQVSKELNFKAVANWSFNDAVITTSTPFYKGLRFSGAVSNEKAKGHLVIKDNATVEIPVNAGEKIIITYYYSANFSVVADQVVTTSSNSTSLFETVEYAYSGSEAGVMTITNISGTSYITNIAVAKVVPYSASITVGAGKQYATINEALDAVRAMNRTADQRVSLLIEPGNYEEMLIIDVENVSFVNASATPSIALLNKGVDIDDNAVRITSYYGHGYDYYSMGNNQKWSADALWINKENGYLGYKNAGSGTTNGSYWNATVVVSAKGFEASHIIFENSFNQYISQKEANDVVLEWESGGKGTRPTTYGSTDVQNKSFVERAAAIAYTAGGDRSILKECRVVGRQDSFFGAEGARIAVYKGSLMGGTDYLFGGMTLVAYQTDLAMNTSDASSDVSYITAAQQSKSRGYLLYGCTITSAIPGTETASASGSKPGYFGRPWQANTGEAVFYNTLIKASTNTSAAGQSLILPLGWLDTLGGASEKSYEYGTTEEAGVDNSSARASWAQVLSAPTLTDGTEITLLNFTKGTDGWNPFEELLTGIENVGADGSQENALQMLQLADRVRITGITIPTKVMVYNMSGVLYSATTLGEDGEISLPQGLWIIRAVNAKTQVAAKALIK